MARTKAVRKAAAKAKERWVVKAGSNMIMSGGPMLIRAWMNQIVRLRKTRKIEVIWVSSGAIATAAERTDFTKKKRMLSEKQALSAIGQPLIIDLYSLALQTHGVLGAQVLLTYDDLSHASRKKNLQNTLEQLLKWGVVPVLNENDAVATEEIRFGDNDSLSARVARVMKADRLVILTDVEGYFDQDPRRFPQARLIPELKSVTAGALRKLQAAGGKAGTSRGTGGMLSKLLAARMASSAGVETWLVKGDEANVLQQVAERAPVGTRIRARGKSGRSGQSKARKK